MADYKANRGLSNAAYLVCLSHLMIMAMVIISWRGGHTHNRMLPAQFTISSLASGITPAAAVFGGRSPTPTRMPSPMSCSCSSQHKVISGIEIPRTWRMLRKSARCNCYKYLTELTIEFCVVNRHGRGVSPLYPYSQCSFDHSGHSSRGIRNEKCTGSFQRWT